MKVSMKNHLKKSLLMWSRKEVTIVRDLELPKSDRHPGPDACKLLQNCKQQNDGGGGGDGVAQPTWQVLC